LYAADNFSDNINSSNWYTISISYEVPD